MHSSAISLWILRIFNSFVVHLSSCFHDSTSGLAMVVETRGNNFSLGQRQLLLGQRFAVLSTFLEGRLKIETQRMTRYVRYHTWKAPQVISGRVSQIQKHSSVG